MSQKTSRHWNYAVRQQEKDNEEKRRQILDHETVELGSVELFAVFCNLGRYKFRLYDPSDQDCSQYGQYRHSDLADHVIRTLENAAVVAVGEMNIKFQNVKAKADDCACGNKYQG